MFSRVVLGTPIVLFLALTSTLLAVILGGFLGLLSGFAGGWFDGAVMRIFEVFISIPVLVFALLVITAAGMKMSGNYFLLIGVVALVYLPRTGRMTRAVALDLVTRDYITVARARGEFDLVHRLARTPSQRHGGLVGRVWCASWLRAHPHRFVEFSRFRRPATYPRVGTDDQREPGCADDCSVYRAGSRSGPVRPGDQPQPLHRWCGPCVRSPSATVNLPFSASELAESVDTQAHPGILGPRH